MHGGYTADAQSRGRRYDVTAVGGGWPTGLLCGAAFASIISRMISNWRAREGRSLGSALLLTLFLLLAAVCVPSASAATAGCQEDGNYETCFIYGETESTLLVSRIRGKVDATARASAAGESGNYIRIALYDWKADGGGLALASSLVNAADSGVSVRLVIGTAAAAVKTELAKADIGITYCADACATPGSGAMHNKFFLIRKGDTKLVMQSSSNIGSTQARHAQNMLVVRDDAALFSAYVNYWRRLNAKSWTYDGVTWGTDASRTHDGGNDLSKAYFFPQPHSTRVADVLGNVSDCAEGNDRVWVEASLLDSSSYSSGVIAQLNRLESLGCDVKVVVQKGAGRDTLLAKGIASSDVRCDGYSHNKVIVLDAKYAGQWRKAVFVGSYNLTENSATRANDAMLRVINGWVTNRYIEQFRQLWANPRACD